MRVAFLTRTPQPHSIYPDVCELLSRSGVGVETIFGDRVLFRMSELEPRADLYVLRERTLPAFSLALALAAAGARFLIPLDRERVVRNRFLTQQTLTDAGIPSPRGWMIGSAEALAKIVHGEGPVILKPPDVSAGKGVRKVRALAGVPRELSGPLFAQELVTQTAADIKLYGIGSHVRAIRRRFPALSIDDKRGVEITPTSDMLRLAIRCREAFGLALFGVDLIESRRGLLVVDVNSTPGYKGVPGAAESVAELIRSAA